MSGIAEEASSPLLSFMSISPTALGWLRELKSDERGLLLIHLLLNCASHVSANNLDQANSFLEQISFLSSPEGDTMQRIASYFTEALALRVLRSWPGLYRALNPSSAAASSAAAVRRVFLDICPFLRLSFAVTNQSILESMRGERFIHIIDLGVSDPAQWLAFLQALAGRPDGPPHLRITAVGDHKEDLLRTGSILSEEAEKLDIPFRFAAVASKLESFCAERLGVKSGEAVAVSAALRLHSLLSSDHTTQRFLSSIRSLAPKIVVLTEQESNHNGAALKERFIEALNFYAALFDCLESTAGRESLERVAVERMMFGEEIKNIVGCEGGERKERHEKLERWVLRMEKAGFGREPLSCCALLQARSLLLQQGFAVDGYKVVEENGCFLFCWQDRPLFSVSAWNSRSFD